MQFGRPDYCFNLSRLLSGLSGPDSRHGANFIRRVLPRALLDFGPILVICKISREQTMSQKSNRTNRETVKNARRETTKLHCPAHSF